MKKKILTLTVSKQWFDMIVAGEKTEEYREIKPYWIKRLTTNCEVAYDVAAETHCGEVLYRPYTHVLFVNGYRRDSRVLRRRFAASLSASQREVCVQTDGWIMNSSSLSSNNQSPPSHHGWVGIFTMNIIQKNLKHNN